MLSPASAVHLPSRVFVSRTCLGNCAGTMLAQSSAIFPLAAARPAVALTRRFASSAHWAFASLMPPHEETMPAMELAKCVTDSIDDERSCSHCTGAWSRTGPLQRFVDAQMYRADLIPSATASELSSTHRG